MFTLERERATFNKQTLTELVYQTKQAHQLFLEKQALFNSDPTLAFNPSELHQSRSDMMKINAQKLLKYHSLKMFDKLDGGQNQMDKVFFIGYQMPLSLHSLMFLTTLRNLCDKQQEKMFLEPALRGQILGCYAQTQLAHGSDVQNLMTTATYDEANQQFIINTPEIGAAKWWVGDLGINCTHAAIFAQLIINGKRLGVHSFLVPIRDKNHQPYEGIEVGDIGPKYGFQTKDNGFVIFKHYRIPRRNMLMKFHLVAANGQYKLVGNEKISYATMLVTRAVLPEFGYYDMSKATLVSVRYSLFRTQFKDKFNKEIPILNYQLQQEKILPRISETYAFLFAYRTIKQMSRHVFSEAQKGKFEMLNEAHSITSSVKAIITIQTLKGLQILRRAAGGHGFSYNSGLVGYIHEYTACYTLEGQYTVLMLQVARFLMKCLKRIQKGKQLFESAKYLSNLMQQPITYNLQTTQSVKCPIAINNILIGNSCQSLKKLSEKMMKGMGDGISQQKIWNQHVNLDLIDAATIHSQIWIYNNFKQTVDSLASNPPLQNAMSRLLMLYGIQKILQRSSKFFESGTITGLTLQSIQAAKLQLLTQIRPDALTFVEAFDFADDTLQSAIGTSNSNAYENMYKWGKDHSVLNQDSVKQSIIAEIVKAKSLLRPTL